MCSDAVVALFLAGAVGYLARVTVAGDGLEDRPGGLVHGVSVFDDVRFAGDGVVKLFVSADQNPTRSMPRTRSKWGSLLRIGRPC